MLTLGQVYAILVQKHLDDPGGKQAWVDKETNTIWVLGGKNVLFRFQPRVIMKEMTDWEVDELVGFILAMEEDEEQWAMEQSTSSLSTLNTTS